MISKRMIYTCFTFPSQIKQLELFSKDKSESQNAAVNSITRQTDEEHAETYLTGERTSAISYVEACELENPQNTTDICFENSGNSPFSVVTNIRYIKFDFFIICKFI